MYIYEVSDLDLGLWKKLDTLKDPWHQIGVFVRAALELRRTNTGGLETWDGGGEYWLSPLPLPYPNNYIVVICPGINPFRTGFVISPIALPGVVKKVS